MRLIPLSKLLIVCSCIAIFYSEDIRSQVVIQSGELFAEVSNYIDSMPGSFGNEYEDPGISDLAVWETILTEIRNGEYSEAAVNAISLGYQLIEYTDTTTSPNRTYYILRTNSSNHWGFYVYNPDACRSLVIQSPHPQKDLNTGKQGIHVFIETNASFFLLSGTNRCNSKQFSSCDGTTNICTGSTEDYRISDLAHNDISIFQKTTEILLNASNDNHFIQLHGFTKLSTDPYVILSNGTQITPSPDYLVTFRDALFDEDNTLTFKTAHIDLDWTRLRGFFNTQGRLINGNSDACNSNATATQGRFFHIEQEKTKLRDDVTGWNKIANALNNTFDCVPLTVGENSEKTPLSIYPNPAHNELTIHGPDLLIEEIKIFTMLGQDITREVQVSRLNGDKLQLNTSELPAALYIIIVGDEAIIFAKK